MRQGRRSTYWLTVCAMLLTIMLILGWVESSLPSLSIPGIKLGLSNGVLVFAVYMLDIPTAYILMLLKVTLSGLLFSGPSAMIYALAGGTLSLTCMCALSRVRGLHPVIVSMAGGVMHNVGQVAMAMVVLHSPRQMLYYLAILMLVGLLCGALTGIAAHLTMGHMKHISWKRLVPAGRSSPVWFLGAGLFIVAVIYAVFSMKPN